MFITAVCVLFFIRLRSLPVDNDKLAILGTDLAIDSKFATNKELIVLNTLRCKYCVNKSRDMSENHFKLIQLHCGFSVSLIR